MRTRSSDPAGCLVLVGAAAAVLVLGLLGAWLRRRLEAAQPWVDPWALGAVLAGAVAFARGAAPLRSRAPWAPIGRALLAVAVGAVVAVLPVAILQQRRADDGAQLAAATLGVALGLVAVPLAFRSTAAPLRRPLDGRALAGVAALVAVVVGARLATVGAAEHRRLADVQTTARALTAAAPKLDRLARRVADWERFRASCPADVSRALGARLRELGLVGDALAGRVQSPVEGIPGDAVAVDASGAPAAAPAGLAAHVRAAARSSACEGAVPPLDGARAVLAARSRATTAAAWRSLERRAEAALGPLAAEPPAPESLFPAVVVVEGSACGETPVAVYRSEGGGETESLYRYACRSTVAWVAPQRGVLLAAVTGRGSAGPSSIPARLTRTLHTGGLLGTYTSSDADFRNSNTHGNALERAEEAGRRALLRWGLAR